MAIQGIHWQHSAIKDLDWPYLKMKIFDQQTFQIRFEVEIQLKRLIIGSPTLKLGCQLIDLNVRFTLKCTKRLISSASLESLDYTALS